MLLNIEAEFSFQCLKISFDSERKVHFISVEIWAEISETTKVMQIVIRFPGREIAHIELRIRALS